MTDEQIKEMLNGIINNGEKWECRHTVQVNKSIDFPEYEWSNWQSYKLGDEIHADWEYRKVETWLEETFPLGLIVGDLHMEGEKERKGATEVCKKILEEVNKNVVFKDFNNYEHGKALCITLDKLEKIIKDLGVNV